MGKEQLQAEWDATVATIRESQYETIARRAKALNLHRKEYLSGDARKMIVLDTTIDGLSEDDARKYLYIQKNYNHLGRGGYCRLIAIDALRAGGVTGVLRTHSGAHEATGWVNHWVNYSVHPSGATIALDFSTAASLDWNKGELHLLGIHVPRMELLIPAVNGVYGGDWHTVPPDEILRFYTFH